MQVVTGLLIAEVNVKTMCELGSGGVSLVIFLTCLGLSGQNLVSLCWLITLSSGIYSS